MSWQRTGQPEVGGIMRQGAEGHALGNNGSGRGLTCMIGSH